MVAKCFEEPKPSKTPSHKKAKNPMNNVPETRNRRSFVVEVSVSVFDKISTRSTKNIETVKETKMERKKQILIKDLLKLLFQ